MEVSKGARDALKSLADMLDAHGYELREANVLLRKGGRDIPLALFRGEWHVVEEVRHG